MSDYLSFSKHKLVMLNPVTPFLQNNLFRLPYREGFNNTTKLRQNPTIRNSQGPREPRLHPMWRIARKIARILAIIGMRSLWEHHQGHRITVRERSQAFRRTSLEVRARRRGREKREWWRRYLWIEGHLIIKDQRRSKGWARLSCIHRFLIQHLSSTSMINHHLISKWATTPPLSR